MKYNLKKIYCGIFSISIYADLAHKTFINYFVGTTSS